MAIGVDDISFVTGTGSSNTLSHDSGGSNRAVAAMQSFYPSSGESVSGVTYAGAALSSVGNATNALSERVEMWKKAASASGTNNLITTLSGSVSFVIGAISLTGAEQVTANLTRAAATANGSGTSVSVNATSAAGDLVLDAIAQYAAVETADAGQTERYNDNTADIYGAASTKPAVGASTTMGWTFDASAGRVQIAAAFVPAATGLSATVNQVTETDTAQPIAWAPKRRLVGQVTETDTAQPIAWAPKRRLVGQVTEADTAQAITPRKARTLGQVLETDLAQPITRSGVTVAVGQVVETDLAQPIAWAPKRRLVGQVIEIDLAQPITVGATTATVSEWLLRARRRGRR